jgi:hypothetical protein
MRPELRHALGKQQARAAFLVGEQDDGHRGRPPAVGRHGLALEAGEMRARPREERVVEGAQQGGV